jgi:hypothetical protein
MRGVKNDEEFYSGYMEGRRQVKMWQNKGISNNINKYKFFCKATEKDGFAKCFPLLG